MPDAGTLLLVAAICLAGGFIGGIVGVGGGVLFVPAMVIFLGFDQVDAEATSLLMIVAVSLAGAIRQRGYGNVNVRDAAWIAALSPVGVGVGVVVANAVPERALELGFAGLCVFVAAELIRKPRGGAPPAAGVEPVGSMSGGATGSGAHAEPPGSVPHDQGSAAGNSRHRGRLDE